ncbi:MAG: ribonuclease III [Clostridia bacterium]|nr:ribonuclease III [Clostridia bacterium]MBQ8792959.1 ribonuclease III [Clostridia bacterium]
MKFLGYKFKDVGLIERALTHSSKSEINYERLEFLGDSILDFLVGEYFYKHCQQSEGRLTVLRSQYVSENHLVKVFDKLKLTKFVKLGKSYQGEISKAIKGDVIEAIIGAIYLDGGLEEARKFILRYFDLDDYKNMVDENYKSKLQELVQGNFKCKMAYHTQPSENGFKASFFMDEDEISSGEGKSKAEAEQMAARLAIEKLFLL